MQVLQEDVDRERAAKADGKGVAAIDLGPLPVVDVGDPPPPQRGRRFDARRYLALAEAGEYCPLRETERSHP